MNHQPALQRSYPVLVALAIIAFCFSSATARGISAQEKTAPERVSADTPRTTAGGATFTVPAGWSIATSKNMVILEPPDADAHIAIVDSQAADAKAAVAAAWAAYKPESKR